MVGAETLASLAAPDQGPVPCRGRGRALRLPWRRPTATSPGATRMAGLPTIRPDPPPARPSICLESSTSRRPRPSPIPSPSWTRTSTRRPKTRRVRSRWARPPRRRSRRNAAVAPDPSRAASKPKSPGIDPRPARSEPRPSSSSREPLARRPKPRHQGRRRATASRSEIDKVGQPIEATPEGETFEGRRRIRMIVGAVAGGILLLCAIVVWRSLRPDDIDAEAGATRRRRTSRWGRCPR